MKCIFLMPAFVCCFIKTTFSEILRKDCKFEGDFSILLSNYSDLQQILNTTKAAGRRECVLDCLSLETCKAVNFQTSSGNCELIGSGIHSGLVTRQGWVYITTKRNKVNNGQLCKKLSPCQNRGVCEDTCSKPGFKCTCKNTHTGAHCENKREFANCKAVYVAGFTTSGIYKLTNMGYHYCVMSSLGECSGVGWTLIMRTKGGLETFRHGSSYWTSSETYNHVYALKYGMGIGEEAKFDAFNKMSFSKVCLGFDLSGTRTYLEITKSASSMRSVMNSGYAATSFGRNKWLGLLSGSYLQPHCNREGFNTLNVRLGITGNNENDCITVDSFLGIGIGAGSTFCNQQPIVKTGNKACTGTPTVYNVIADGFLLVK